VRAVLQRVSRASVRVAGALVGQIDRGLLVLVGVATGDGPADIAYIANKIREVRIFPDEEGKMNRSVVEANGAVLVVSQFTLMGDVRKGRRPAFDAAEAPDQARVAYEALLTALRDAALRVEAGVFQAHMDVELVNDGPVTILIDSRKII
jgi:D-tyrosyl-tRNA(Tyr) deacylase